jgi:uncharacterized membrane protein YecN with MAPEG domain
MGLFITPIYAALLGLIFVVLSIKTIIIRRQNKVAVGDGNNLLLQRAMRVHANFAEYTPIAIILVGFVEGLKYNVIIVHILLTAFLLGRIIHAYGLSKIDEDFRFRVFGMVLTFNVITISSALIIFNFLI